MLIGRILEPLWSGDLRRRRITRQLLAIEKVQERVDDVLTFLIEETITRVKRDRARLCIGDRAVELLDSTRRFPDDCLCEDGQSRQILIRLQEDIDLGVTLVDSMHILLRILIIDLAESNVIRSLVEDSRLQQKPTMRSRPERQRSHLLCLAF